MSQNSESVFSAVSADLLAVGVLGVYAFSVATGLIGDHPGRALFAAVGLIFAPGYALVCGLFPRSHSNEPVHQRIRATVSDDPRRITVVERLLLAVGMSLCLVPLLGLALIFAGISIQLSNFVGTVGLTTAGLTAVAWVRRRQVPRSERFDPRLSTLFDWFPARPRGGNLQSKLSILLIVGFVIAGAGISIAVLGADRGERFTEFGIVTEDPETGDLTADGYPDELNRTESERIHVTITNNEGQPVEYTVLTLVETVDSDEQREQAEQVDSFTVNTQAGETVREQRSIDPDLSGENLRLTYLLYIDSPPETRTPAPETAYRSVHIWVDVPDGL